MSAPAARLRQVGPAHTAVRQALATGLGRDPDRLLISGVWAHRAARDARVGVDGFFCAPELVHSAEAEDLVRSTAAAATSAHRVSVKIIERLADRVGVRPDGLISVIRLPRWHPDRLRLPSDPLVVVADGLQSPGNLGAVIRTIDATGADLLLACNVRARPDSSKVFLGSRGRSLSTPNVVLGDAAEALGWLADRSVRILVADADRGRRHTEVDFDGPTAIVLGNERYGPSADWGGCERVHIPMLGRADSLNVAVSAGVLLYQARARRDGW